jgi:hypothetical protein
MSASGVVSIAFAKIGFVLLCTIPWHLASQTRRAVVFKILNDIETIRMQPILALCFSLHRMPVHRLVALVRVEMKPPALQIEDSGQRFVIPL